MKLRETALLPLIPKTLFLVPPKKNDGAEFFFDFLVPDEEDDEGDAAAEGDGSEFVALSAGLTVTTLIDSCKMGRRPFCSLALHSMYALE